MATDHFCLKWNNFHNSIVTAFESLQSSEELVDVTLMCEGQNVKAHKVILSACSPYFRNLFKENPCQHPVIILKDVLHCDLVAILQFMYQGEVLITQDGLASFLKTAELLQVSGLAGNTATTRPTSENNVETILPTQQLLVPLLSPQPPHVSPPASPAKLTPAPKNHSPLLESVAHDATEKEIEELEPPVLSRFEPAPEPVQSCSYDPHDEMVIKTEKDEVDFPEMEYTSMSHDTTNDSGPPTEEQSILERSLKAHDTQNLFILNEPNIRQIVEKEKVDRYIPSNAKLFIKCPYCCKSMLKKSFKKHLKYCTFMKSNKPLRPAVGDDRDKSLDLDCEFIDIETVESDKETEYISPIKTIKKGEESTPIKTMKKGDESSPFESIKKGEESSLVESINKGEDSFPVKTIKKRVKESPTVTCPRCDKVIKWKFNLKKHLTVCKFKKLDQSDENVDEIIIKRVTRGASRKSVDYRSYLTEMAELKTDVNVKTKRNTRKSLDCRTNGVSLDPDDKDRQSSSSSLVEATICSHVSDTNDMRKKRRLSTRKSVDCRNCAGCC